MAPWPQQEQPPPRRTSGGNGAFHNFYNDFSHIADPNLRQRLALADIDRVPFGLYHVRAVLVAGAGFLLDSYDIFAINFVISLLGVVFWSDEHRADGFGGNRGTLPEATVQALKGSTSAGIVLGMMMFGGLADAFGRRSMYGLELGVIIVATLGCALASASPSMGSTALLVFWCVVMLSARRHRHRWRLSAVVDHHIRIRTDTMARRHDGGRLRHAGYRAGAVRAGGAADDGGIATEAQCDAVCRTAADWAWSVVIGVGALPACLALYYRMTIPETPRYTFDVQHDVEKADADIRAYVRSKTAAYARAGPTRRCCGRRARLEPT